jgi:hypothetical protein
VDRKVKISSAIILIVVCAFAAFKTDFLTVDQAMNLEGSVYTASNSAQFDTACVRVAAKGGTIVVTDTVTVGKLTMPTKSKLKMIGRGFIKGLTNTSADSIKIYGFEAENNKCFGDSLTVQFSPGAVEAVRPEWFGARGDSSTINTVPIQRAMNTFSVVKFEKGVYLHGIIYPNDNQALIGDNKYNTVLKKTSLLAGININSKDNVEIRDIGIDGSNGTGSGILFQNGCTNLTVKNCRFKGAYQVGPQFHLALSNVLNATVENCDFVGGNFYHAIQIYTVSKNVRVTNCTFSDVVNDDDDGGTCINCDGQPGGENQNILISNCIFKNSYNGIKFQYTKFGTISACVFDSLKNGLILNFTTSAVPTHVPQHTIIGNQFRNCDTFDLWQFGTLTNPDKKTPVAIITGNTFKGTIKHNA